MRPLPAMLLLALLTAALSGCTASTDAPTAPLEEPSEGFQTALFEGAPDAGQPAGEEGSHGSPQRDDGTVESGMEAPTQIPSAWARRTVTITNDFGGASLGTVFAGVDAGAITIAPGEGDSYELVVLIEARGLTEQDARDALDRVEVSHDDVMEDDGLHLTTVVREKPAQQMIPLVQVGYGAWADVSLTLTLPAGPAYDLTADASFGAVDVSGLRGPSFLLSASSGSIEAEELNAGLLSIETSSGNADLMTIQAEELEANLSSGSLTAEEMRVGKAVIDVSSGSIVLEGIFDTLEADAGSGSMEIEARALSSGAYDLAASSGDIELKLLTSTEPLRAYHVTADAGSGEVTVELDDADTLDEEDDHAEVISEAFDAAAIKTVIEVETGSGSIDVSDRAVGEPSEDDEDEDEDDGEHNHGG